MGWAGQGGSCMGGGSPRLPAPPLLGMCVSTTCSLHLRSSGPRDKGVTPPSSALPSPFPFWEVSRTDRFQAVPTPARCMGHQAQGGQASPAAPGCPGTDDVFLNPGGVLKRPRFTVLVGGVTQEFSEGAWWGAWGALVLGLRLLGPHQGTLGAGGVLEGFGRPGPGIII